MHCSPRPRARFAGARRCGRHAAPHRRPCPVERVGRVPRTRRAGGLRQAGSDVGEAGGAQSACGRRVRGRVAVEVAREHDRPVERCAGGIDCLGDLRAAPVGRAPASPLPVGAAGRGVEINRAAPAEARRPYRAAQHPARAEEAFLQCLVREWLARSLFDRMARESEQPGAVESAVFRDAGAVGIEIAERRRQLLFDALRDQLLQEHDIGVHTAQRWREVGGARTTCGTSLYSAAPNRRISVRPVLKVRTLSIGASLPCVRRAMKAGALRPRPCPGHRGELRLTRKRPAKSSATARPIQGLGTSPK